MYFESIAGWLHRGASVTAMTGKYSDSNRAVIVRQWLETGGVEGRRGRELDR